jgi:hypothetical protein
MAAASLSYGDAEVRAERFGKTIALFRCTQILLYPDRVLSG